MIDGAKTFGWTLATVLCLGAAGAAAQEEPEGEATPSPAATASVTPAATPDPALPVAPVPAVSPVPAPPVAPVPAVSPVPAPAPAEPPTEGSVPERGDPAEDPADDGSVEDARDSAGVEPDDARDLAAELDALRFEVERLREAIEPDSAMDEGPRETGLRPVDLASRAPGRIRLGGVATAGAVLAEESDAQFVLPRAALFAYAPVGDRVSFGGEVTLLGGGAEHVDADRGMPGRGDVFLQYAAVDLVVVPDLLVLRGGLVAVPVGRANLLADESVEELFVRPAEALYVVPTPWSDVGGGLLGGAYLGRTRVEWQAYVLSGPAAGIDARSGFRGARQPPGTDRNADKALAGRLSFAPADGLEIGLSGYTGAYSPGGGRRASLAALDLAAGAGPVLFEGEAVYARTDGGIGSMGLPIPKSLAGGSARVTWRFLPELLGGALPAALQGSSIGASVRYSLVDTDLDDPDESPDAADPGAYTRRDRLGVGLSFRPVPRYVLRAEYEFRTEARSELLDDDRAVFSATAAF